MGIGMSMGSAFDPNRYQLATKTATFAGATPNALGDYDGTLHHYTLFTVTGDVIIKLIAVCTVDLAHAANATIQVGIAGGLEIITTTDLTTEELTARELWNDATPTLEIELLSTSKDYIITDGNDITLAVGVANVNTGAIVFYCLWTPLSSDGLVVTG